MSQHLNLVILLCKMLTSIYIQNIVINATRKYKLKICENRFKKKIFFYMLDYFIFVNFLFEYS